MHVGIHCAELFCRAEVHPVFSHISVSNYYANDRNYVSRGLSLSVWREIEKVKGDFPACLGEINRKEREIQYSLCSSTLRYWRLLISLLSVHLNVDEEQNNWTTTVPFVQY